MLNFPPFAFSALSKYKELTRVEEECGSTLVSIVQEECALFSLLWDFFSVRRIRNVEEWYAHRRRKSFVDFYL